MRMRRPAVHKGPAHVSLPRSAGDGLGPRGAHRLTVLRPGPLVDMGVPRHIADMYADVFPYLSLAGLDIYREENRRGNTMRDRDESHIQSRTGGTRTGKLRDSRTHHAQREPLTEARETRGRKG